MSANHCLEVVLVSSFAIRCRMSGQHWSLPAFRCLRFAIVSLVAVLLSLLCRREATHVCIVLASAVMLIHGFEDVNVVCCALCCPDILDMHNRQSCHANRNGVIQTLSSSWDHHMRPFCCCSGPARCKFALVAMTAPMTHLIAST